MQADQAFYHYLPVDERTLDWGAYLTGVGYGTIHPGEPYPPATHPKLYAMDWKQGRTLPEFQLILLTDGSGQFECADTGVETFAGNVLIFLYPGHWHTYHPDSETGWTERWVSFNGELLHRLEKFNVLSPKRALVHIGDCDDFVLHFDEFLNRVHTNPVQNSVLLSLHLLSLLGDALDLCQQPAPPASDHADSRSMSTKDPVVDRAMEIIWTFSHQAISVPDVARQLGVNRRMLDRRFADARGHSVLHEINTCRLSRVRRLLERTELPIKKVAYLAGFSSPEQMRTTFQSIESKAPSDYRALYTRRLSRKSSG